jgi:hypothetical protein
LFQFSLNSRYFILYSVGDRNGYEQTMDVHRKNCSCRLQVAGCKFFGR